MRRRRIHNLQKKIKANEMATLTLMPESAIHQHSTCKEAAGGETGSNALIGTEDAADQAAAEQHAPYWKTLQNMLAQKREMVLDFTSLKACLDPQKEKSDGDDFNYEDFLYEQMEKGETFSSLEMLKVRNLKIPNPLTPQKEDYYADLLHGTMQLSSLVELDLSGLILPPELQQNLKFWNLQSLKRLCLDGVGLTVFPPSVGRLRKLEVLSVTNNKMNDLPVTLAFCQNLKELNLQKNSFTRLPGIILRLPNLRDLRRLDNPLPSLWNGFAQPPHINIKTPSAPTTKEKPTFNPDSLQTLCTKVAFSHHIDYWTNGRVGPLQCKILDHLASQFTVCEHCNAAIPKKGTSNFSVDVMLVRYLDLRFVPVQFSTCSDSCQAAVLQHYRKLQTQTQADLDREYENSVKQADRLAKSSDVDISTSRTGVQAHQIEHYNASLYPYRNVNTRRRRKCAIM